MCTLADQRGVDLPEACVNSLCPFCCCLLVPGLTCRVRVHHNRRDMSKKTGAQCRTETTVAIAKHTFKARTSEELSFEKGAQLTILQDIDENFWKAKLGSETGFVPKLYVTVRAGVRSPTARQLEADIKAVGRTSVCRRRRHTKRTEMVLFGFDAVSKFPHIYVLYFLFRYNRA